MKTDELRQQDKKTLQTTLDDLNKKKFKLKMQLGSGQLTTNHLIKQVRRDIARVKTIMTEMQKGSSV